MRRGILGGTFDPIHHGHVVVAAEARSRLGLDAVLLVPAGDPWQKRGAVVASGRHRLEMVARAVRRFPGLEVSAVEIDRDGPSVTADTLEALGAPDEQFVLLLGADAATNMPTWRRLEETRGLAGVAVVERAGEHAEPPGPGWRWEHVPVPRLDLSSSDIRARLAAGRPIAGMVPTAVIDYIEQHGLYTSPR